MLRQIMSSLLLLFIILPTCIDGLKCGSGGTCYGSLDVGTPFALKPKECQDACVAFKCFVDDGEVMEGAGCYDDFHNTCKYTGTEIKDTIKKNINQSLISKYDVYFTSCSDSDGCATNGLTGPWILSTSQGDHFGEGFKNVTDPACNYDKKSMTQLERVICTTVISCESGYDYRQSSEFPIPIDGPNKTCNACMKFICTPDGQTVTTGHGCYEDFEEACKFLNNDLKANVRRNIKDSLYYDKNYFIFSCSDSNDCQLQGGEILGNYQRVNYNAESGVIVDGNARETCDKTTTTFTTPSPTTTTTSPQKETTISPSTASQKQPQDKTDQTNADEVFTTTIKPSSAANGQFNAFKLQKIITIFGIILIYLL